MNEIIVPEYIAQDFLMQYICFLIKPRADASEGRNTCLLLYLQRIIYTCVTWILLVIEGCLVF